MPHKDCPIRSLRSLLDCCKKGWAIVALTSFHMIATIELILYDRWSVVSIWYRYDRWTFLAIIWKPGVSPLTSVLSSTFDISNRSALVLRKVFFLFIKTRTSNPRLPAKTYKFVDKHLSQIFTRVKKKKTKYGIFTESSGAMFEFWYYRGIIMNANRSLQLCDHT